MLYYLIEQIDLENRITASLRLLKYMARHNYGMWYWLATLRVFCLFQTFYHTFTCFYVYYTIFQLYELSYSSFARPKIMFVHFQTFSHFNLRQERQTFSFMKCFKYSWFHIIKGCPRTKFFIFAQISKADYICLSSKIRSDLPKLKKWGRFFSRICFPIYWKDSWTLRCAFLPRISEKI